MTDIKSTYAAFAEAFLDEQGGRFSAVNKTTHTATTPVYPELPENSPFHVDPVGQEPPLGFSVEDHQPVGTYQEVQASLERSGETGPSPGHQPDGGDAQRSGTGVLDPFSHAAQPQPSPPTSTDDKR